MAGAVLVLFGGIVSPGQTEDPSGVQPTASAEPAPVEAEPAATVDFEQDIRPMLDAHCGDCHQGSTQEGGFSLATRARAVAGGDSGEPAIVPADPTGSRLLRLVSGQVEKLRMPPEGEAEPLTAAQIELLSRWIAEGASWGDESRDATAAPTHWAWRAPQAAVLPEVHGNAWVRNGIDAWVLSRLEAEEIVPAAEADRWTLARRVSLDLIGLPPEPEAVAEFVADDAPDAYERYVDGLLLDPGFGERWARVWLDLARYADSKGYGSDPLRSIWRYRDWVIEAFNRDLPYDQFTIEQLAGDLLPGATDEQRLATAMHRNTMANDEGGTDDEEFRIAAVKDRVDTTAQVWMGLTLGCAKCHSHKYDPFTQREYYQFFAILNQTEDADRGDEGPRHPTPTREQAARRGALVIEIAALEAELQRADASLDAEQAAWEAQAALAMRLVGDAVVPVGVREALGRPAAERSAAGWESLRRFFRGVTPSLAAVRRELAARRIALEQLDREIPQTPVLAELPADRRRTTHLLLKGNFLTPGPVVEPGLPAALHRLPDGAEANRLGLARWLVDEHNPLTARVAVNRVWAQLFGTGLVESEEDFGTQGVAPSHPELLDWLAVTYQRDLQWRFNGLLRLLVTSATYRQASAVRPELRERDPGNRLLARGPSGRLEAEMVRDQALALAGLLSRKQGGPSVFPPQPEGLWRAAFNGERTWATSAGEDRYRRALYTFWRRTVPYPSLVTFDAPSRENCTVRRRGTNTPLQALVTMNDPVYVEAAQALARRETLSAEGGTEARARRLLERALVRPAEGRQVAELVALYSEVVAEMRQDHAAAVQLATEPLGPLPDGADAVELAAWTVVSNVVLNLDGVLCKR